MPTSEPLINDPHLVDRLVQVCGPEYVSQQTSDRLAYARDMWPRCLIRQRAGFLDHPPDVVVWPADSEQVGQVVRLAAAARVPLVPFGAGSGVCGATLPHRGGIVCDLKRLDRIRDLDEVSGLLHVEVGVVGEVLERELNRRGFTCGHFPSSMICSTVGGWVAARGAGQCSSRYGKIEDMVLALEYTDGQGRSIRTPLRAAGSGWSLVPLLVGSEGTAGVLTSVVMAVRRLPEQRWFRAFRFPGIEQGLEAMRLMLRQGLRPTVLRLYDEFDTVIAGSGSREEEPQDALWHTLGRRLAGPARQLFKLSLPRLLAAPALLNRLGRLAPLGCQLVVVQEGPEQQCRQAAESITALCRAGRATDLGPGPALHWWENRYAVSYKQSSIFAAGAFVDTMEVATTWDRLADLYQGVRRAVEPLAFIMAHFSHAWREGCSIYFTFAAAARADDQAAALYDSIWNNAQDAVHASGGVVSHHHGIGLLKSRFLRRQLGAGWPVLQAIKRAFDPDDVFNPGKLGLDESPERQSAVVPGTAVDHVESAADDSWWPGLQAALGRRSSRSLPEMPVPAGRPPLAVFRPDSAEEVALLAGRLRREGVALVVAGSGSRLVDCPPDRMPERYVLAMLDGLQGVEVCQPDSLWVEVKAGTRVSELVRYCRQRGLRPAARLPALGSVGGWLARGVVVNDPLIGLDTPPVLSLEVAMPDGRLVRTQPTPRAATGPEPLALWLGTWGVCGVITAAVLKLEPLPDKVGRRACELEDAGAAVDLLTGLARGPLLPRQLAACFPSAGGARLAVSYEGRAELVQMGLAWAVRQMATAEARPLPDDRAGEILAQPDSPGSVPGIPLTWRRLREQLRPGRARPLLVWQGGHAGCLAAGDVELDQEQHRAAGEVTRVLAGVRGQLDAAGLCNPQAWPPGWPGGAW